MNTFLQKSRQLLFITALAALPIVAHSDLNSAGDGTLEWNFRVFLDDSEIGYHRFKLTRTEDRQQLETEANFKVKFLFFTAYRYFHVNKEIWDGKCLARIESRTATNGKKLAVSGARRADSFQVEANGELKELDPCVKTFAYWDPDVLDENALLNSQTGEMVPIRVEELPPEPIKALGETVDASRYRLVSDKLDVDLWYSENSRWLGLETTVKGGRTLRYELI